MGCCLIAQLVHSNHQDIHYGSSNQMILLVGSGLKTEKDHLNIEIVTALLICNASTPLNYWEMFNLIINKLKVHPTGMATLINDFFVQRNQICLYLI